MDPLFTFTHFYNPENTKQMSKICKWPESDAEFVKSAAGHGGARPRSRVVDSVSCRQMYLRSYTFSRKETVPERTMKCLIRVRERLMIGLRKERQEVRRRRLKGLRRRVAVRRLKEFSCAAVRAIFRRLLFCAATVDVVEHGV